MNKDYSWGFFLGLVSVLIIVGVTVLVVKYLLKASPIKYDERQQLSRGVGYKYALIAYVIYSFINMLYDTSSENSWADPGMQFIVGLLIAITVLVSVWIAKDAWLSLHETPKRTIILIATMGLLNLFMGLTFFSGHNPGTGPSGMLLTLKFANLAVAAMSAVVLIVYSIKLLIDKISNERE